jgi:hypothetical protein
MASSSDAGPSQAGPPRHEPTAVFGWNVRRTRMPKVSPGPNSTAALLPKYSTLVYFTGRDRPRSLIKTQVRTGAFDLPIHFVWRLV